MSLGEGCWRCLFFSSIPLYSICISPSVYRVIICLGCGFGAIAQRQFWAVACSQDVAWTSRATSLGLHNAFGFRAWAFLAIGLSVYDGGKCQLLHKL